jgi:hypothetical protein
MKDRRSEGGLFGKEGGTLASYPSKRGSDYPGSLGRSATKSTGTLALVRFSSVWRPSTREEGGRGRACGRLWLAPECALGAAGARSGGMDWWQQSVDPSYRSRHVPLARTRGEVSRGMPHRTIRGLASHRLKSGDSHGQGSVGWRGERMQTARSRPECLSERSLVPAARARLPSKRAQAHRRTLEGGGYSKDEEICKAMGFRRLRRS